MVMQTGLMSKMRSLSSYHLTIAQSDILVFTCILRNGHGQKSKHKSARLICFENAAAHFLHGCQSKTLKLQNASMPPKNANTDIAYWITKIRS